MQEHERPNASVRTTKTSPRVSVVTTFLNAEAFISEAIESVRAQTYDNWELLLVDDGSTDASTRIARDCAKRLAGQVHYLEHPDHINRGASPSRNLGISKARGQFIAFIDADDVWLPSKLSDQLSIMDAHPDVQLVAGSTFYWSDTKHGEDKVVPSGHVQECVIRPPEAALAIYPLGAAAAPCPSDLLIRTNLAMKLGGFDERFVEEKQLYEDQVFLMKVYLAAPIYFSSKVWLKYRLHSASCSAKTEKRGDYHDIRRFFLDWLEEYLGTLQGVDPRVVAALGQAQRPYRGHR